ncbi:MAG: HGGxSTG domain-containing protein [Gammaproteobacteria bacterium]
MSTARFQHYYPPGSGLIPVASPSRPRRVPVASPSRPRRVPVASPSRPRRVPVASPAPAAGAFFPKAPASGCGTSLSGSVRRRRRRAVRPVNDRCIAISRTWDLRDTVRRRTEESRGSALWGVSATVRAPARALWGSYMAGRKATRIRLHGVCGARTRRGTLCQCTNVPGRGRCRFHGGLSTGPKSLDGRATALWNLISFKRDFRSIAEIRRYLMALEGHTLIDPGHNSPE